MQKEIAEKLGEELVNQIKEAGVDPDDLVSKADGAYVPREVLKKETDKLKDENKALQDTIKERDAGLEELQKKVAAGEDATAQIIELTEKNTLSQAEFDSKLLLIQKKAEAKLILTKEEALNPELLVDKINYDTVTQVGDDFAGLLEQITAMKFGAYRSQFGKTILKGDPPPDGNNPQVKTDLDKLKKDYDEAQKSGNTSLMVSLKPKIHELSKKQQE